MKKRGLFWFVICLSTLLLAARSAAQDPVQFYPKSDADMFKVTVRIMNDAQSSGGTGSILVSNKSGSVVLTNKHVCRLIEHGGVVEAPSHEIYPVKAFKEDTDHDLCLIKINANLGINLVLSEDVPAPGDPAIIAGHPALLPTIVTRGHFSEHMNIHVADGQRDCTEADKASEEHGLECAFTGKVTLEIPREAQLVSATIMPGSSGSPVFNAKGEIAGVVFAGQGQLSYGLIVPLEYLNSFMEAQADMDWTKAL